MLQILSGPAHSGKTQHFFSELKTRMEQGERSWVLVPEQFSLFTEKEMIRRFGLPSQKFIKIITFSRLCNLVLHETGPLRMQYIDGAGKHLLASRAMELSKDQLTRLKRNLSQKGFSKVLTDTISECKRYGVSPKALAFASEQIENRELSEKLAELSHLYQTYNTLMEKHYADAEDNLELVCSKLEKTSFLHGKIFVRHFRSFTPVEHRALGELMKKADLAVFLDTSSEKEYGGIFAPVEATARKLQETAQNLEITEIPTQYFAPPQPTDPLSYLRQSYFNYRSKPLETEVDSVVLYEAQNRHREMEMVADLILRLCRTEQYRFRDFLILTRNPDSYLRILPSLFETRKIPVFLDAKEPLFGKPLFRLLSGTLDILAYGHSYERIMTIARCGLLPLSIDQVDRLENYLLATAPTHAMWQTPVWDYLPSRGDYSLEEINHTKDVLLSGVAYLQQQITGRKTGGEIAGALLSWFKESELSQRITDLAQEALDQGNPRLSDEYLQTWNALLSLLSQVAAMMDDTSMTYQQFAELFRELCADVSVGRIPQTLDCVVFSGIDRFRSGGAKVVIVLDTTEGVFPKGFSSEGFLSDEERHLLKNLGLELAPNLESKQREEQLLLNEVFHAPTEKLYFFRPLTDNDGKSYQPSSILKRVRELLPEVSVLNPDTSADPLAGAEGGSAAFSLLATALSRCGGKKDLLSPPLQELYRWFQNHPNHKDALLQLETAMNAAPPSTLSKEMVTALYGTPLSLSASQLETYNACAFRYFLNYGLLLRERDLAGMEPRSMGDIQHASLYHYFSELKHAGADFTTITKDACFQRVSALVEEESKKDNSLLYEASSYYQYIVLRMKDISSRTAWEVVKFYQNSRFRPYGFEIAIGTKGPIPALSVKAPDGRELAKIRGFIDRADTAVSADGKTMVSIVDYKSSAKNLDITLAKDGITLQPLLYSSALCHSIGQAIPAAMFYLQMNDPILLEKDASGDPEGAIDKAMKPRGWVVQDPDVSVAYSTNGEETFLPKGKNFYVSPRELSERMEEANRKIQESAMDITQGIIGANPYRTQKHDACEYCAYHGICQKHG